MTDNEDLRKELFSIFLFSFARAYVSVADDMVYQTSDESLLKGSQNNVIIVTINIIMIIFSINSDCRSIKNNHTSPVGIVLCVLLLTKTLLIIVVVIIIVF